MLSSPAQQVILAAVLALAIVGVARLVRALSWSGAIAAFVVGFTVFAIGGMAAAVPLIAFFVSSSLLSRVGRKAKAAARQAYDKSDARDAMQVVANGGVAALIILVSAVSSRPRDCLLLYLCAVAAANADTWATEIGGLYRGRPRLVTTLRRVDPGTSGAVSWLGLLAALVGAAFIAGMGRAAWPDGRDLLFMPQADPAELLAVTWAGLVAAFGDSILGASVQAQYQCPRCAKVSERSEHCGAPARRVRGWRWMTNDAVNVLNTSLGVLFGWILLRFFSAMQ